MVRMDVELIVKCARLWTTVTWPAVMASVRKTENVYVNQTSRVPIATTKSIRSTDSHTTFPSKKTSQLWVTNGFTSNPNLLPNPTGLYLYCQLKYSTTCTYPMDKIRTQISSLMMFCIKKYGQMKVSVLDKRVLGWGNGDLWRRWKS